MMDEEADIGLQLTRRVIEPGFWDSNGSRVSRTAMKKRTLMQPLFVRQWTRKTKGFPSWTVAWYTPCLLCWKIESTLTHFFRWKLQNCALVRLFSAETVSYLHSDFGCKTLIIAKDPLTKKYTTKDPPREIQILSKATPSRSDPRHQWLLLLHRAVRQTSQNHLHFHPSPRWATGRKWHLFDGKTPDDMGVSENGGTPKSSISIGISSINHPFWGTTIFGNTHMFFFM